MVLAQSKKEDEALAAAVTQFDRELKMDLEQLKAGGAPYQVTREMS